MNNENDELNAYLMLYGRTIADSCVHERTASKVFEEIRDGYFNEIAPYMGAADVASRCSTNAPFYWSEQPFLFSSFPVQDTFLSIAIARSREGRRGEPWRHKGYIYSEEAVVSRSRVREYFAKELSFVDGRKEDPFKRVKFITIRDGRFDCSPADLDEAVFSNEVEWLWFVWDSFASITDDTREASSSSSLGRVHKHICQIATADRIAAEQDLNGLISKGWQKVPYALHITQSPTTP